MAEHALHGLGIEQFAGIGECSADAAVVLTQVQDDVELGSGSFLADCFQGEFTALQLALGGSVLQDELDLEQGTASEVPAGGQFFYQLLEGKVLMIVGGPAGLAGSVE